MSREPINLFGLIKDTGVETHGILLKWNTTKQENSIWKLHNAGTFHSDYLLGGKKQ